jgi:hypothetical protein
VFYIAGRIVERFLMIGSPESTTSQDLHAFLTQALGDKGIDIGRILKYINKWRV